MKWRATTVPLSQINATSQLRFLMGDTEELNKPSRAWRWLGIWIVLLGIGVATFAMLIANTSLESLATVWRRADRGLLLLFIISRLLISALRAGRFNLLNSGQLRQRFSSLLGIFLTNRLIGFVFPFRTGELASLSILKRKGFTASVSAGVPIWGLIRVLDLAGLSSVLLMLCPLDERFSRMVIVGASLATLGGAVFYAFSRGARGVNWNPSRAGIFGNLVMGFRTVHSRRLSAALALSALIWSTLTAAMTIGVAAMQPGMTLAETICCAAITAALGALPIQAPLGIGTGEIAWVGGMLAMGMTVEAALPVAILLRALSLFTMFLEGSAGALLLWRDRNQSVAI